MSSLTGFWEGQYKYPNSWQSPVNFDAEITDKGGALSGLITEPNSFDSDAGHILTSVIAGTVSGDKVSFTKTYVGEGHAQHSIQYEGTLSENNSRISGNWKMAAVGGGWGGKFEMSRLSGGAEKATEMEAALKLTR